ncbi:uncharacterized protein (DUF2141 family) [Saonia flava]|uniref:Uncharacterized protein (DUF2141 family) n=1 Tax=Saonia flava TaxID=523696 RepID=A0A846QY34_9FLAO|nr:DUF2141 domain-containing protein [Saonia flava]NJB72107.1 uncharacterized protein (DUF2141 family) [Saonia flava]
MKKALFIVGCLLTSFISTAQENVSLTVSIDNVQSNEGKVMVSLHTADTFMKGPGIQNVESVIENGKVTFTIENVAPGNYAIMALHDANENRRMDFDAAGMPQEHYGMSNNPMSYGPPTFESAKFEVTNTDMDLEIRF